MSSDKIGTKQKLLTVATELFGRLGLEAVSTRMIAAEANINVSAISYYFNGKDSLYLECVKNLVRTKQQQMQGTFDLIQRQVDKDKTDVAAFKELLHHLVFSLLSVFVKEKEKIDRNIILREIMSPTSAYDIIRSKLFDAMHEQLSQIIYFANGGELTSIEAQVKTTAVIGFIRSISLPDDRLLKSLGISEFDDKNKEVLTTHIMSLAI